MEEEKVKKEEKKKTGRKRGPGEGSLSKRPDGTWMVQISAPDLVTGDRKRITKYAKGHKEAKAILISLLSNVQQGIQVVPSKILFSAWLNSWLENYAKLKSKGTYEAYQLIVNKHLNPNLGKHTLAKLTTSMIQEFYVLKLKDHAVSTVRLMHVVIHSALKQAQREHLVQFNVSDATMLPNVVKKEVTPMSHSDVEKLIRIVKKDRLYATYAVELSSGMRRGELLALTWDDIDMSTGLCKITKAWIQGPKGGPPYLGLPKTKSSIRNITLPNQVLMVLRSHKRQQAKEKLQAGSVYADNNLIFCSETGQALFPKRFSNYFKTLLKMAGVDAVRFHNLRHTVASELLRKGKSMKATQALLGHSTMAMTSDIYSHIVEEIKQDTADTLGDLFFNKKPVAVVRQ